MHWKKWVSQKHRKAPAELTVPLSFFSKSFSCCYKQTTSSTTQFLSSAQCLLLTDLEFAADADQCQFLGVDLRLVGSLGKQRLDEGIPADDHQLLQTGVQRVVVLVQEVSLNEAKMTR